MGRDRKLGLVSYAIYLPEGYETAEQVAQASGLSPEDILNLGIKKKCKPSDEDQPIIMAEKAARLALERADSIDAKDVDLVLWTGEEYKDYIAQTAAIRLQEEVGCKNAWSFDLIEQGVTTVVGLRVARDLMIGDDTIRTVLLAGGTRNVDLVDYKNLDTRWMLPVSASGGAILLSRDYPENSLLEIEITVDSEMADEVYVPGGGTVHPFSGENLGTDMMYFQVQNPEKVNSYMDDQFPANIVDVIKRTVKDAGYHEKDLDYLAIRHLPSHKAARVLDELDIDAGKTEALEDVGHHGTNDVIISLDRGLQKGLIKDGSLVAMVTAGIGFKYCAALFKWGAE